jgi:FSR family fosmidomycin resistance protein-like MFS transporter
VLIAFASTYGVVLVAAGLIGMGSSVFQVGGNFGTALGPLLAAFIVLPYGQGSIAWFSVVALLGMVLLAGGSARGTARR